MNSAVPAMRKRRGPRRDVTIFASSSSRLTWLGSGLGLGLRLGLGLPLGLGFGSGLG